MRKIAVVEDNPDNRLLVRVILEPHYEVAEYETGPSALEGLAREKPDVLLLDISLPEMDGMEVLRRLRAHSELRTLPVIALTAHAMAGDREKYLGLGFDDYVTKPIVDENVLLEAIQRKLPAEVSAPLAEAGTANFAEGSRFAVPPSDGSGESAGGPPAGPPPKAPALETGALDRMRKLGGDSFAAEMIGIFLEYTAQKLAQGLQAHAAGDLAGVQNAMHPIKSSAGNVGAVQIQALAARIEDLAGKRQGDSLGALLAEINQAFTLAKPQFESTRQTLLNS
jgi:CheY-like chemotaxis protein/HPt (histidine-containing phosphotransfer) domain-containing protein